MNSIKDLVRSTTNLFRWRRAILPAGKDSPERCLSGGGKPHRLVYDFRPWPSRIQQLTVDPSNCFVIIRSNANFEFPVEMRRLFRKGNPSHNFLPAPHDQ